MMALDWLGTFRSLLARDMYVLKKELPSRFVNALVMVSLQVIVTKYFFPLFGMQQSLIAPLFLTTVIQILSFVGYNMALSSVLDRNNSRIIDYHLMLPIPKSVLFAEYACNFMVESFIIAAPLVIFGLLALQPAFSFSMIHWLQLPVMSFCILLFFAIFFLWLGYAYSFMWFMDNIWARRIAPLYLFGCTLYTWKKIYSISPQWATLILVNPFTYCLEGLRSVLLASIDYIPFSICSSALILFSIFFSWRLSVAIHNQLDPV